MPITTVRGSVFDPDIVLQDIPAPTFRVDLGVDRPVQSTAVSYAQLADDINNVIRFTGTGSYTLLPAATAGNDFHVSIYADGGVVTVDPNAAETVNGEATVTLQDGASGELFCTGAEWFLLLGPSVQTINEAGADVDFRVESDTEDRALFVRGSDGRVIFGTPYGGTQYTHEVAINDATTGSSSITGGSGFYPQSSDTLSIGNRDGTIANGYTSLHMLRGGSGGSAAAKIVLRNLGAGNSRLSFMLRDIAHLTSIDTKMHIDHVGVTVNPLSTDRDFQVKSDTDGNALYVRGSDGKVGVGAGAPLAKLHVRTGASGAPWISTSADELTLESDGNAGLTIATPNTNAAYITYADGDAGAAAYHKYDHTTDTYTFLIGANSLHKIATGETVINGSGIDHDFRVNAGGYGWGMFVRGSDGKVGIGESAPLSNMHITSGSSGLGSVNSSADELILESAGNTGMTLMSPNTGYQYVTFADADNTLAASLRYSHPTDEFSFYINGVSYFDVAASEVVVNESGADVDFRVESDTDTHAFFLEGSSGHIGIGTSTPLSPLEIEIPTGDSGSASGIRMVSADGGGWGVYPASAVANPVWNTDVNSGESHAWSVGGTNKMSLSDGLQLGAPTGGDKGTGTLNAVGLYTGDLTVTGTVTSTDIDASIAAVAPMTTQGDIIYGAASGVATRLPKGTAAQSLVMNAGATAPEWVTTGVVSAIVGGVYGFEFANEVSVPGHGVEISAGQCWDTTRAYVITGAAMNKQITGLWVVGDTQGAWDVGTAPADEGCYWYAIRKDSDASVDYVCSLSATWAGVTKTRLTGYTYGQKLMYTTFDATNDLYPFTQYGDTLVTDSPQTISAGDSIVSTNVFQDYINVYAPAYSVATVHLYASDATTASGGLTLSLATFDSGYDGSARATGHIICYVGSGSSVLVGMTGQGDVPLNGDRKFLATASESSVCTISLYANKFTMTDRFNSAA